MATEVLLPQWGMNMTDGTLTKWLKQEGDAVAEGEPLVEIETAKINSELESPVAGVVAHIMVSEGETVPVGALVAVIAAPGEVVPRPAPSAPPPKTEIASPPSVGPTATAAPRQPSPQVQIVPAARLLASRHGIDLATVVGSGPNGRILEADVQAAIQLAVPGDVERVPLTTLRKTIAARMLQSSQTMAPVTLTTEADVTEVRRLQAEIVSRWRSDRARPADMIFAIKTIARALEEHPYLNARFTPDHLEIFKTINIGFAVSSDRGLVVPVVKDVAALSLIALNEQVRGLARKGQRGELSLDDVEGGTFTLTTLGQHDIDAFTPIIPAPQVAILGTGRVVEKPVVREGEIVRRLMTTLSLTFDHRATDGEPAARFLKKVKTYLEDPWWMLNEEEFRS